MLFWGTQRKVVSSALSFAMAVAAAPLRDPNMREIARICADSRSAEVYLQGRGLIPTVNVPPGPVSNPNPYTLLESA